MGASTYACFLVLLFPICFCGDISLYDYFTEEPITEGLTALGQEFKLNGKEIKILSGSLHYFRYKQFYQYQLYQSAASSALIIFYKTLMIQNYKCEVSFIINKFILTRS